MDAAIFGPIGMLSKQRTSPLILELDLTEGVIENRPAEPLAAIMTRRQLAVTEIVSGLKLAREDPRVRALVVRLGHKPIGLALVQELRAAVQKFGATGKPTIAWTESFGELSRGNIPYFLATAFKTIYLQPSGDLGLTGLAVERTFLRGSLDRIGIEFQVGKRHEYKSATEQVTERAYSAPAREQTQRISESVTEQIVSAIAEHCDIPSDRAAELINSGPYVAEQALEAGLVDALGYRDEVYAAVRKQAGPDAILLYLSRYQRSKDISNRAKTLIAPRRDSVALVYATGMIRQGRSGRSPLTGAAMGSDSVTATLRAASADPNIRAIVLRVNSPGGSYVASDSIWREVVRTRNAGKPVVVSMSDVAASGGYYISMAADVILAHPATVTGSIGVFVGKPVVAEMLGKAGVTTDSVVTGPRATMFSTHRPFSDDEWAIVDSWLDRIYADFTSKVAAGRGLSAERVHELARGRVWTGADAKDSKLVDDLGGIEEAAQVARRRSGLPASAPLVHYPRLGALERLRPASNSEDRRAMVAAGDGATGRSGSGRAARTAAAVIGAGAFAEYWGPVWQIAERLGLPPEGPLTLPGSWTFH